MIFWTRPAAWRKDNGGGIEALTPQQALGIGAAQILALWPGTSSPLLHRARLVSPWVGHGPGNRSFRLGDWTPDVLGQCRPGGQGLRRLARARGVDSLWCLPDSPGPGGFLGPAREVIPLFPAVPGLPCKFEGNRDRARKKRAHAGAGLLEARRAKEVMGIIWTGLGVLLVLSLAQLLPPGSVLLCFLPLSPGQLDWARWSPDRRISVRMVRVGRVVPAGDQFRPGPPPSAPGSSAPAAFRIAWSGAGRVIHRSAPLSSGGPH